MIDSTLTFPHEPDSDIVFSDSASGNAGIRVVQVLWSHLVNDALPCDHVFLKYGGRLSE